MFREVGHLAVIGRPAGRADGKHPSSESEPENESGSIRIQREPARFAQRVRKQPQIKERKKHRVFVFLPPTLYVADDWLSRGLAIGDTIINLVSGLGGTPK